MRTLRVEMYTRNTMECLRHSILLPYASILALEHDLFSCTLKIRYRDDVVEGFVRRDFDFDALRMHMNDDNLFTVSISDMPVDKV